MHVHTLTHAEWQKRLEYMVLALRPWHEHHTDCHFISAQSTYAQGPTELKYAGTCRKSSCPASCGKENCLWNQVSHLRDSWCLSKVGLKPQQPRRPVGNAHGSRSKSSPRMPGLTGESPWITKPFPKPQTPSGRLSFRHLLLGMNEFNWNLLP